MQDKVATQPSRVGEYRDQAATLRQFAEHAKFFDTRRRLLALADGFDRLADHLAAAEATTQRRRSAPFARVV